MNGFQSRGGSYVGGSKVNSAFHPSDVDKMSTRNFWELIGKKYTASSKWF